MKCTVKFRPSSHSDDGTNLYLQAMRIEVSVPRGITMETFPLILGGEELRLVSTLIRLCGEPETTLKNERQTWLFKYAGTEIRYRPSRNGCEPLLFVMGRKYKINSKLRMLRCTETVKNASGRTEDLYLLAP